MNDAQQFKLIDGTFTGADAAQVLLSLVRSKIDFHHLQKASNEERLGHDPAHSQQRLAELTKLHDTVKALCQTATEGKRRMRVQGWIEVTLEPCAAAS